MDPFASLRRLSAPARRGLLVHSLQWQAVQVGSLYVSVYLFKLGGGYQLPAWYALWTYAAVPLGSYLGAALARLKGAGAALRAGLALYAAAQALVLALGPDAARWIAGIGLLWGLAMGVYWQAWTLLMVDLSEEGEDRDLLLGASQAASFLAGLSGVPLAGLYLTLQGGTKGYGAVFAAAMALFLAAWAGSLALKGRALHASPAAGRLLRAPKPEGWSAGMWSALATGVLSVGSQFLPMLVCVDVGGDENHAGAYSGLVALAGFAAAALEARLMSPGRRLRFMGWSALAVCLLTLPLAFLRSYPLVLVYGLGMAVSTTFFNMPLFAAQIRIIEANPHFRHRRADALFLRELPLAAGRLLACAAVLWGVRSAQSPGLTLLLLALAATPLLCFAVLRPYLSQETGAGV